MLEPRPAPGPHTGSRPATPKFPCYEFRKLLEARRVYATPAELPGIERALARIGEGTYGNCAACGGDIGRGFLKSNPVADRCQGCAIS